MVRARAAGFWALAPFVLATLLASSGCYLSNERPRAGDVPPLDLGPTAGAAPLDAPPDAVLRGLRLMGLGRAPAVVARG